MFLKSTKYLYSITRQFIVLCLVFRVTQAISRSLPLASEAPTRVRIFSRAVASKTGTAFKFNSIYHQRTLNLLKSTKSVDHITCAEREWLLAETDRHSLSRARVFSFHPHHSASGREISSRLQ